MAEGRKWSVLLATLALMVFFSASLVKGDVRLVAHKGYCKSAPENTLASFAAAKKAGFTWIETDVQETADGYLVMFHDTNVDGKTNGKGRLSNLKSSYVLSLQYDTGNRRSGAVYRIPTLVQTLNYCSSNGLRPILHLRGVKDYKKLDRACRKVSFYKNIVYMCSPAAAVKLRAVNPSALIMGFHDGSESIASTLVNYQSKVKIQYYNIMGSSATNGNLNYLNKKGLTCCAWTINKVKTAFSRYQAGCSWIITDSVTPSEFKAYAKKNSLPTVVFTQVKAKGKRAVNVQWKKQTEATGYEIVCSQYKDPLRSSRLQADRTTTSVDLRTGSTGTYYVYIRSWRRVDGSTVYSEWSAPKAVNVY